jgi:hypothetical protein
MHSIQPNSIKRTSCTTSNHFSRQLGRRRPITFIGIQEVQNLKVVQAGNLSVGGSSPIDKLYNKWVDHHQQTSWLLIVQQVVQLVRWGARPDTDKLCNTSTDGLPPTDKLVHCYQLVRMLPDSALFSGTGFRHTPMKNCSTNLSL